jgi:hypothetical protein
VIAAVSPDYGAGRLHPGYARADARDDVLAATGKRQQPYVYGSMPALPIFQAGSLRTGKITGNFLIFQPFLPASGAICANFSCYFRALLEIPCSA